MSEPTTVIFGNQRHASIWALRNGKRDVNPHKIIIATRGEPGFRGVVGPLHVVRVTPEVWLPTTWPCEKRVKETEEVIKRFKDKGEVVTEEMLM